MMYDFMDERRPVDLTVKHVFTDELECAALGRLTEEWQNALDICRGQEFNIHVLWDLHHEGVIDLRRRWNYEIFEGKTRFTSADYYFRLKPDVWEGRSSLVHAKWHVKPVPRRHRHEESGGTQVQHLSCQTPYTDGFHEPSKS